MTKNNILRALFDIKPVDETGRVDVGKIEKVQPVVNLVPILSRQGWIQNRGSSISQSNLSDLSEIGTNKETPEKGVSSRSFKTRSIIGKTVLTAGLSPLYSRTSHLSTIGTVDKSEAPVDPTGLAPVTPAVKTGYLLHNTTGPLPGLGKDYHRQIKKQSSELTTSQVVPTCDVKAQLEKYLNSKLNIRRELGA